VLNKVRPQTLGSYGTYYRYGYGPAATGDGGHANGKPAILPAPAAADLAPAASTPN
jgi:hypothetical protein